MTEELYQKDMYMKEFNAKVVSIKDGKFVVLDKTAFYPKGGGVANDEGKLIRLKDNVEYKVIYIGKFGGEVSHEIESVESDSTLEEGDEVKGVLDWERRYSLMRYHTAVHTLSGVFYKNVSGKITGNNIETTQARMDLNIENFDRKLIENCVNQANEVIKKNLPVEVYFISREEMDKDPDLIKLAMGLPKQIKNVRIVDIKGFDRQPDGGCHVGNLEEVGEIKIKKLVNKGKNNRRLYFTLS